ncbi:T9SS type A sorting domain-containing protein [Cryomorpha ignava]|uniref:T9SS type A sorting domain-containing protein n=1 Tax=Cryomorpha ignava TaxID=101383 RepID=A0A7K3WMS3_9FLAO|nr:T9SS type A sorting domain-containing protein [Cryomorpha ignava]NEN22828.1 T9SS type A sorting domain-containing protein [Cryomorpha ignava]
MGLNEKDRIDKLLEIFPNPASNLLNIYFPTRGSGQVTVFDLSGKMLLNEIYFGEQMQVDVSDFPSGMYLIRVADDEKVAVKKFVVE